MKIIFLDFDGVLTTSKAYGVLDKEKMALLQKIIEQTGAKIVISSSWRCLDLDSTIYSLTLGKDYIGTPLDWLKDAVGVTIRPTEDEFNMVEYWSREDEIKMYLKDHAGEIDQFIILDDQEDEFDELLPHLVKTTIKTGITEETVKQAIQLLNDGKN
jgi:hypothetical protein